MSTTWLSLRSLVEFVLLSSLLFLVIVTGASFEARVSCVGG